MAKTNKELQAEVLELQEKLEQATSGAGGTGTAVLQSELKQAQEALRVTVLKNAELEELARQLQAEIDAHSGGTVQDDDAVRAATMREQVLLDALRPFAGIAKSILPMMDTRRLSAMDVGVSRSSLVGAVSLVDPAWRPPGSTDDVGE